jgi:hypothetical protein
MSRALAAACGTGLLALTGCYGTGCGYDDVVDPCYPQRYDAMAIHEVNEAMAPQMLNGHILEQTVWNDQFEADSDRLTPGGQEHLKFLARRRPHADPVVFLETAQDVKYDPASPEKYVQARADLNNKRVQAIQKFLGAYTAAAPQEFRVVVHDAPEPGQSAIGVARAVLLMHNSYQGALQAGGGAGATGGGGAAAAAGGPGR